MLLSGGARAELLFCDHVNGAPRAFTERNDGEHTYPFCLRFFEGSVAIVKPGLAYPGGGSDACSNAYGIANGYMTVTPLTRALQMYLDRVQEDDSNDVSLAVSVLVRCVSSGGPRSWAGVSLLFGSTPIASAGIVGTEDKWTIRGLNTKVKSFTARGVKFNYRDEKIHKGTGGPAKRGQTYLVVLWMRSRGRHMLWGAAINPATAHDAELRGVSGGGERLPLFDTVSFDADGAKLLVDELRIGTSLEDVLPGQAVPADVAQRSFALPACARSAIIAVKGDLRDGTACLARHSGTTYLYSNISVLMGNRGVKFVDYKGRQYKPLRIECARDADLVRMAVSNAPADVLRVGATPSNGTAIAVCPNAYGEYDFTPVYGTLVATGPQRVEVDALFTAALMGSPIITADGQLVGIATHVREPNKDWVNKDTPFVVIRRFGARVDTMPTWQPCAPQLFAQQGGLVAQRDELMGALLTVMATWAPDPGWAYVPPYRWLPRGLRSWAQAHNEEARNNTLRFLNGDTGAPGAIQKTLKEDIRALRTELDRTKSTPPARWLLPYFSEEWQQMDTFAQLLKKALDTAYNEISSPSATQ
jgi:hypothetical protein